VPGRILIGVATASVVPKRKRKYFAAIATFQITKIRIKFQERKLRQKQKSSAFCATFCPVLSTVCGPRCSKVPYFKLSIVDQQQPFWSG
jgi:hypothetical protein